ncbi:hypothetical protein [Hymenobacter nivis]|uniref:hypothetical protein n=1 Tax=Hymenobacter nivis TaxID=1850093 RepID=UPI0011293185|nr:hypothetical protein [Hymenobacter nivis]
MRCFLLYLLLFLAGGRAFAQTTPSMARTDSLVAASQAVVQAQQLAAQASAATAQANAATDTVGALHRLYAARRHRRLLIAGGFIAVTAAGLAIDQNRDNPGQYQGLVNIAFVVLVGVPVLAANFFYHAHYSRKKERRTIAAFEAHQLPASTKAQLQSKFFQLPNSATQR